MAGSARAEPPRSRFYLSHFRPRRTTSKSIGSNLVEARSVASCRPISFTGTERLPPITSHSRTSRGVVRPPSPMAHVMSTFVRKRAGSGVPCFSLPQKRGEPKNATAGSERIENRCPCESYLAPDDWFYTGPEAVRAPQVWTAHISRWRPLEREAMICCRPGCSRQYSIRSRSSSDSPPASPSVLATHS